MGVENLNQYHVIQKAQINCKHNRYFDLPGTGSRTFSTLIKTNNVGHMYIMTYPRKLYTVEHIIHHRARKGCLALVTLDCSTTHNVLKLNCSCEYGVK